MCENIVKLKSVYIQKDINSGYTAIFLVLHYASHGSILKYLHNERSIAEEQIRIIMAQLILATDLMHRRNIVHRDIKPDNILIIDKKELKICISDLGLACRTNDNAETKVKCGTPGYVAPEILKNQPFTDKSDVFSMGCVFFNMITSCNLYHGRNNKEMLFSNKYQDPTVSV